MFKNKNDKIQKMIERELTTRIQVRGIDIETMIALNRESTKRDISVNKLVLLILKAYVEDELT